MNKHSKALLALLVITGNNAAGSMLHERTVFKSVQPEPIIFKELLLEKKLLLLAPQQIFKLNESCAEDNIVTSNDSELTEFISWLKSLAGSEILISYKKPGDMTPASQDISGPT